METRRRTEGTRRGVHDELLFRGHRVSVEADGKALEEMQSGDGCTNVAKVHLTPLDCLPKMINVVGLMSCVFHIIKH